MKIFFALLIFFAMLLPGATPSSAQAPTLSVVLTTPAENETFYAGPSTLVYSVNVTGGILTNNPEPSLIRIRLDVLRGSEIVGTQNARAQGDGSFSFIITINPDASAGHFKPEQSGCEQCHHLAGLGLPNGKLTLRVTAAQPDGRQAIVERKITVDRSDYATVPVRVVNADNPNEILANVPVVGSTRLYLWRTRYGVAQTDATGTAFVRVEALSQSATQYSFRVEPRIVDGAMYSSTHSIALTLPPAAKSADAITLRVTRQLGQITGAINAPQPVAVRAINRTTGASYTTQTQDGKFNFVRLPLAEYLVGNGTAEKYQSVDLTQSLNASVNLKIVAPKAGRDVSGSFHDKNGRVVPFGWVSIERTGSSQRIEPGTGSFTSSLPRDAATLIASAPGFYAQAQVIEPNASQNNCVLTPRPELREIKWGNGEISVPPESQGIFDTQRIVLEYGWVWGRNDSPEPFVIALPDAEIRIERGNFAIEYFPESNAWLYVSSGQAQARYKNQKDWVVVNASEMLTLKEFSRAAVPYDAVVIALLTNEEPRTPLVWEATLEAQWRDGLARLGIGVAQAATFLTYLGIVLVPILTPVAGIIWFARNRMKGRQ